jgi:hypothetical protein
VNQLHRITGTNHRANSANSVTADRSIPLEAPKVECSCGIYAAISACSKCRRWQRLVCLNSYFYKCIEKCVKRFGALRARQYLGLQIKSLLQFRLRSIGRFRVARRCEPIQGKSTAYKPLPIIPRNTDATPQFDFRSQKETRKTRVPPHLSSSGCTQP